MTKVNISNHILKYRPWIYDQSQYCAWKQISTYMSYDWACKKQSDQCPPGTRGHGQVQDAYQASEVGVNLQSGYNASLTSREEAAWAARWSRRCVL